MVFSPSIPYLGYLLYKPLACRIHGTKAFQQTCRSQGNADPSVISLLFVKRMRWF